MSSVHVNMFTPPKIIFTVSLSLSMIEACVYQSSFLYKTSRMKGRCFPMLKYFGFRVTWARTSLRSSSDPRVLLMKSMEQPELQRSSSFCRASRSGRYCWGSWSIRTRSKPFLQFWSRNKWSVRITLAELDVNTWNWRCKKNSSFLWGFYFYLFSFFPF